MSGARRVIGKEFGERYVPKVARKYTVKATAGTEVEDPVGFAGLMAELF